MCMSKVKDFMDAGITCSVFLADWHSYINDKLGGDLDIIKQVAVGYFMNGLKASLKCLGGDPDKLTFVLGSDLYHHNDEYWQTVIDISKNTSLSRMMRSITILGRKEGEGVDFAKLMYPPMQVADIFTQNIHLPHAGLDQRKAQVIARDVATKIKKPLLDDNGVVVKPVAVHHHLLLGLLKPPTWPIPKEELQEALSALKMSKSKPNSSVYIHDSPEEITKKISQAFCMEGEVAFNPILDWTKYLLFREETSSLTIKRPEKFGGDVTYTSYESLRDAFASKDLHPVDLKNAVAQAIIKLLAPAREYFSSEEGANLLAEMNNILVTR